jgi:hypothetical protein
MTTYRTRGLFAPTTHEYQQLPMEELSMNTTLIEIRPTATNHTVPVPRRVAVWYQTDTSWIYHRTESFVSAYSRLAQYAQQFGTLVALFDVDAVPWQGNQHVVYGQARPTGAEEVS